VLEYTSLFANLEELFEAAGGDPDGYRKLLREVANAQGELRTYYDEVTGDFVERLKRRLVQPEVQLSEEEVRFGLAGNLCRCTGYDKVVRAVLDAAAELRGQT